MSPTPASPNRPPAPSPIRATVMLPNRADRGEKHILPWAEKWGDDLRKVGQGNLDDFVKDGRLTGDYGEPRDGKPPHGGVDIGPPNPGQTGVDVTAGVEGIVESFGKENNTVNIRTPDGHLVQLMHLADINVKIGDKVEPGDVIGEMGGTGPKGPNQYDIHLHIQVQDKNNKIIDPTDYLWPDKDDGNTDGDKGGGGGG